MTALLAGAFTIGIPYAIYLCIKAHLEVLDQNEWKS